MKDLSQKLSGYNRKDNIHYTYISVQSQMGVLFGLNGMWEGLCQLVLTTK